MRTEATKANGTKEQNIANATTHALSENSAEELLKLFGMDRGAFYSERQKLINKLAQGLFPGAVLPQNPTNS